MPCPVMKSLCLEARKTATSSICFSLPISPDADRFRFGIQPRSHRCLVGDVRDARSLNGHRTDRFVGCPVELSQFNLPVGTAQKHYIPVYVADTTLFLDRHPISQAIPADFGQADGLRIRQDGSV